MSNMITRLRKKKGYVLKASLYLSNAKAAGDRTLLDTLGITHVLTVEAVQLPGSTFENSQISTLFIMAYDNYDTNLMPFFPIANSFIDQGMKNGRVMVHCRLGVSRSATIVIAYVMQRYGLTYEEGLIFVRSKRPFINPNPGFRKQLQTYERNHYYVGHFKRLVAYMKVNDGQNKYKLMSFMLVVAGIAVPFAMFMV